MSAPPGQICGIVVKPCDHVFCNGPLYCGGPSQSQSPWNPDLRGRHRAREDGLSGEDAARRRDDVRLDRIVDLRRGEWPREFRSPARALLRLYGHPKTPGA